MFKFIPKSLLSNRVYLLLVLHAGICTLSYWLAFRLGYSFVVPDDLRTVFWTTLPWVIVVKLIVFHRFGNFHGWWSYVTFEDMVALMRVATMSTLVIVGVDFFLARYQVPRSVLALDWGCTILAFGVFRSIWRFAHEGIWLRYIDNHREPVLLVGADQAGVSLARQINNHPGLNCRVVGFLDDNESHHHSRLGGIPVVGGTKQAAQLAVKHDAKDILVIAESTFGDRLRELMERCRTAKVRLKVIPPITALLNSMHRLHMRDININDLLRREPVQLDVEAIEAMIKSRCVMVTGAGGSIGSEICREIMRCQPEKLIMVDRAENSLFQVDWELKRGQRPEVLVARVADIRDEQRMDSIFRRYRPETVFHAAAHKHVPLMETNPGEAIANNVLGTQQLADMAEAYDVDRFVFVSTDKAVNPSSVMGASKQIAERYVQACSECSTTKFVVVRFGNVLASTGSVVPIFQEQIRQGGPVTVTHPEMKRYFMTIPEASQLVLQAAAMGKGGDIFVLDMGEPALILDLARDLIHLSGLSEDEIEIVFTGPRPGEKLFEELLLTEEETLPTRHPKLRIARPRYYSRVDVRNSIGEIAAMIHGDDEKLLQRLMELIPEYSPTGSDKSLGNSIASSPAE